MSELVATRPLEISRHGSTVVSRWYGSQCKATASLVVNSAALLDGRQKLGVEIRLWSFIWRRERVVSTNIRISIDIGPTMPRSVCIKILCRLYIGGHGERGGSLLGGVYGRTGGMVSGI